VTIEELVDDRRVFTLFPSLPVELRLKIWEFSILSRILTAEYTPKLHLRLCTSPSILHTKTEFREVGLRYYEVENHNFVDVGHMIIAPITVDGVERSDWQTGPLVHSIRMYVNFHVDILLFETRYEEVPRITQIVMGRTPPLQLKLENFPFNDHAEDNVG